MFAAKGSALSQAVERTPADRLPSPVVADHVGLRGVGQATGRPAGRDDLMKDLGWGYKLKVYYSQTDQYCLPFACSPTAAAERILKRALHTAEADRGSRPYTYCS